MDPENYENQVKKLNLENAVNVKLDLNKPACGSIHISYDVDAQVPDLEDLLA